MNSLTSKLDKLKAIIPKYLDFPVITETKFDDTFPNAQFLVLGYFKLFCYHRNRKGGRIMIYIREDIPSKLLTKHVLPSYIECIFLELNFRKCKWLLAATYHPLSQNDYYFFENLGKAIDVYIHYEKVLLVGDYNAEISESFQTLFFNNICLRI